MHLWIQCMVIRASRDQLAFDQSPGLIAVFHALLRLLAPRHPPHALSSLAALILSSTARRRKRTSAFFATIAHVAFRELAPMVVAMGGVTLILILSGLMQRNLDKKPSPSRQQPKPPTTSRCSCEATLTATELSKKLGLQRSRLLSRSRCTARMQRLALS